MSLDGFFALFMLVPVARAHRVSLDEQAADLTVGHVLPVLIHDARLVAGQNLATGAWPHRPRTIGDEHVQSFRRADSVKNLHAEALLKAMEDRSRQGFTGG